MRPEDVLRSRGKVYEYTTESDFWFEVPQYNGRVHTIHSRDGRLLAKLTPCGRLEVFKGYSFNCQGFTGELDQLGNKEMYLPCLIRDVLLQMQKHSCNFGYTLYVINRIFLREENRINKKLAKLNYMLACCRLI